MRAELAERTLKELKKRARAEGLDEDAVDDVDDADDPKAAIVELLVAAAVSAAQVASPEPELELELEPEPESEPEQ